MASHVCLENRNFRRGRKRIVAEVPAVIVVEVPDFEEVWKDNMGEVVPKVYKNLVRYYLKRKIQVK